MKKIFEKLIFGKPEALTDTPFHYCAGCGHSVVHRLIAEVIDELKIREKTVGTAPVGCAVFAYNYFNFDVVECAHGRTPVIATGVKRVNPDNVVFSYQGDGDLAAIGMAEIIHCANRAENISVFFVNNAVYGMTTGQMAPTTLINQKTTTTPKGRDIQRDGYPIKVSELLSNLDGCVYAERVAVSSAKDVIRAKHAIRTSFEVQIKKLGFSIVEILSLCPSNWKLPVLDSKKFLEEEMTKVFPLGLIKDTVNVTGGKK